MSKELKSTTANLRKTLVDALARCANGSLDHGDGKNLIGLANQITSNMAVEVKVMAMKKEMGHQTAVFGELEVC